ncbi:MAG: N-formylglutamate deformylase [Colwellia sp.]|nr:N-formylglutamate deformylase [Colwellia sp.]MCW8864762.1 N-formylglutamate deformylase [Colwellia sp.]MCW9081867.1 N-formylglutamate deformylase [Colwellia sp.]
MDSSYQLTTGNIGMLISMPHNGQVIPQDIAATMTDNGLNVADTDWYMDKLYDFASAMGIYTLSPKFSRYVIDLNRNSSGESLYAGANNTELCPTTSFDLSPLYLPNQLPSEQEVQRRIDTYWQPYHQAISSTLTQLKQKYGKVVLLDAHSILSQVPRFFSGTLPDFNFGSADGCSCDEELLKDINKIDFSPYSSVFNGRFKGGYITRAYGDPDNNIHAIQLELSQRTYLDEPSNHYNEQKAEQVKVQLQKFVQCLVDFAQAK